MRTWRSNFAAALAVVALSVSTPGSAAAFGTIEGGGQNREHERITRAALGCSPDTLLDLECVNQMRLRFREGVEGVGAILDGNGEVLPEEVSLDTECNYAAAEDARAKCTSIEAFGRALHGAQDFYAHSNWADTADPARPVGVDNPPGLNRPGPSPVLDLRSSATPSVPPELSTGCYALRDEVPGVGECEGRITHAGLNKDRGLIDPSSGSATQPTTSRGIVGDNFAKAVAGAIAETRRQWEDFRSELAERYGQQKAQMMICALTHDDPASTCQSHPLAAAIGIAVVVGAGIAVAALLVLPNRRRRKPQRG